MSLKEDMERDLAIFLNEEDFAETRTVAGRKIQCILYEDKATDGTDEMGVAQYSYTLQARAADIPNLRAGDTLRVDGNIWAVIDISIDYGMAVIKMSRNG